MQGLEIGEKHCENAKKPATSNSSLNSTFKKNFLPSVSWFVMLACIRFLSLFFSLTPSFSLFLSLYISFILSKPLLYYMQGDSCLLLYLYPKFYDSLASIFLFGILDWLVQTNDLSTIFFFPKVCRFFLQYNLFSNEKLGTIQFILSLEAQELWRKIT